MAAKVVRRKRKVRLKRKGFPPLLAGILVAILGYYGIPWIARSLGDMFIRTVTVEHGVVEQTLAGETIVFRREEVVTAPIDGEARFLVSPGDRVRAGSEVAEVVNLRAKQELEAQLQAAQALLQEHLRTTAAEKAELEARLRALNAAIGEGLLKLAQAAAAGDTLAVVQHEETVKQDLKEREQCRARLSAIEDQTAKLSREVEATAQLANKSVAKLVAPAAGIVSTQFDGQEGALSVERISGYPVKALLSVSEKRSVVRNGDPVKAGAPIFKVVDDREFLLGVVLEGAALKRLQPEQRVRLRPASVSAVTPAAQKATSVPARVFAVGAAEGNGWGVAILASQEFLPEFVTARRLELTVVLSTHEGTVLPKSALTRTGETVGVYLVKRGVATFRAVTVVGSGGDMLVVNGLAAGSEVVKNPRWTREGSRVR